MNTTPSATFRVGRLPEEADDHFLGLHQAARMATDAALLTESLVSKAITRKAMICIHGQVGLGKTFAANAACRKLAPDATVWLQFAQAPNVAQIRSALWDSLDLPGPRPRQHHPHLRRTDQTGTGQQLPHPPAGRSTTPGAHRPGVPAGDVGQEQQNGEDPGHRLRRQRQHPSEDPALRCPALSRPPLAAVQPAHPSRDPHCHPQLSPPVEQRRGRSAAVGRRLRGTRLLPHLGQSHRHPSRRPR